MMVNGKMVKGMVMECWNGYREIYMKEIGKIIWGVELECIIIKMELFMKEIG
jgi:hypothetical protein